MRKLFLFLLLPFVGCTATQKIGYKTSDLEVKQPVKTIPIRVDIRIFEDNRAAFEANGILFEKPRQVVIEKKNYCINSEKHYAKKDTVVTQLTRLMTDHFNQAQLFEKAFYGNSNQSDYYLTGTLNSFYGKQEFSKRAAVGAQFGLIGAMATSGAKTPGEIVIELADIRLYKKDGTLVKDFGTFYKEYNDDFSADAYCWCIYWNMNAMLMDFNTQLVEKIKTEMADFHSSGEIFLK